jgi:hypothetical protein
VKANSEARVDWLVAVTAVGEAKLKVEARADKYADAMEKSFTVYEHGIEKFVSRSGKMRSGSVSINLEIPKARRAETTELSVQIAPSMATTMLDALPYLIDYPYGCTGTDHEPVPARRNHGQDAARSAARSGDRDEPRLRRYRTINCGGHPPDRRAGFWTSSARLPARVSIVSTIFSTPTAAGVGGKKAKAITS